MHLHRDGKTISELTEHIKFGPEADRVEHLPPRSDVR